MKKKKLKVPEKITIYDLRGVPRDYDPEIISFVVAKLNEIISYLEEERKTKK